MGEGERGREGGGRRGERERENADSVRIPALVIYRALGPGVQRHLRRREGRGRNRERHTEKPRQGETPGEWGRLVESKSEGTRPRVGGTQGDSAHLPKPSDGKPQLCQPCCAASGRPWPSLTLSPSPSPEGLQAPCSW